METIKPEMQLEVFVAPEGAIVIEEVWVAMGEHRQPGGKQLCDLTDVPGVKEALLETFAGRLRDEVARRAGCDEAALADDFGRNLA